MTRRSRDVCHLVYRGARVRVRVREEEERGGERRKMRRRGEGKNAK